MSKKTFSLQTRVGYVGLYDLWVQHASSTKDSMEISTRYHWVRIGTFSMKELRDLTFVLGEVVTPREAGGS